MLRLLAARLRRGSSTIPFPPREAGLPERFRGRPALDPARCANRLERCGAGAPSRLVRIDRGGEATLDLGACLFAPEEAAACPEGAITFTRDYRMAASRREALVTPDGEVEQVRALDR